MLRTETAENFDQVSFLHLVETEEDVIENDQVWDNGHIAHQNFLSACCQAPIDQTGSDQFCTCCGEDVDPEEEDLPEITDEEEFFQNDYRDHVRDYWRDVEEYN